MHCVLVAHCPFIAHLLKNVHWQIILLLYKGPKRPCLQKIYILYSRFIFVKGAEETYCYELNVY